jgi:hypothetical protein
MPEHHPERHQARLAQPWGLGQPDLRSVCPRTLLERLRRFPLLAVSLEEDPTGAPSPCVPPRGPWRTPAAASVKGRVRVAIAALNVNLGRSPHIPRRAVKGSHGASTLSGPLASRASRHSQTGRGAHPLSQRRRRFPLLAVTLEEVPTGDPSPYAPPRGSWRTPAAAPVKRRGARAATLCPPTPGDVPARTSLSVLVRRSHHRLTTSPPRKARQ